MDPVQVAFDVVPLAGSRTGVGNAVAALHDELGRRKDVSLVPYLVSVRAPKSLGSKLPIPALAAHRLWATADTPSADRWLPPFDVIHGANYVVPPSSKPRLVSVYDCWFLQRPDLAAPAVRRAGKVLLRSIRRGAHVHTSSQATADALRRFTGDAPITVIPLGALPLPAAGAASPLPELAGRPFVLSLGTLERRKNVPMLIEAFARLAAHETAPLLVIAGGDGDDRTAINSAIDRHRHISDRIVLTRRVDEATRGWLIRNAAVFAYPSLDEGFGFPLLDAMQAGVPIVASDRGSIPEVAADAALLTPADDAELMAEQLRTALTDTVARARLVDAGSRRCRDFTWARTADEMAALYRTLAGR
jgi:glycosyltransferase involved in cell wall biosynthesis